MSGYLCDTNVALLGATEPRRLSAKVRKILLKGPLIISVLSYWEVGIKAATGKLNVKRPRIWWEEVLVNLNATALVLRAEHLTVLHDLPRYHNDPFDRALIAQAISEDLRLLSTDTQMPQYRSAGLKLID